VYLLRLLVAALFIISVSHRLPLRVANSNKVPDMDVRRQYVFHEIWAEAITGELRRLGNRACTMRAVSEDVVANHTSTNESLASIVRQRAALQRLRSNPTQRPSSRSTVS